MYIQLHFKTLCKIEAWRLQFCSLEFDTISWVVTKKKNEIEQEQFSFTALCAMWESDSHEHANVCSWCSKNKNKAKTIWKVLYQSEPGWCCATQPHLWFESSPGNMQIQFQWQFSSKWTTNKQRKHNDNLHLNTHTENVSLIGGNCFTFEQYFQ